MRQSVRHLLREKNEQIPAITRACLKHRFISVFNDKPHMPQPDHTAAALAKLRARTFSSGVAHHQAFERLLFRKIRKVLAVPRRQPKVKIV